MRVGRSVGREEPLRRGEIEDERQVGRLVHRYRRSHSRGLDWVEKEADACGR